MRNVDWVALTDAQRGQLVAIWLLAADHDGVIPASPQVIKKLCFMDAEPDLELFKEQGFIEDDDGTETERRHDDATVTPERRQHDSPETETEKKKISAEPPAAAPVIPLKDGTDYHPPEDLLAEWKAAYPNVVVAEQLLRIAAWNRSNPGKRKTRRGITKHINEWLSRADKEAAKEAKANGSESPAMSRSNPFHPDNML